VNGPPRIVVTGASGFVGGSVARALVDRGVFVRAVYRRSEPPQALRLLARRGAELVRADLERESCAGALVAGCSSVVHAAAKVLDYGRAGDFERANVETTRSLITAAAEAGCSRFLYVSSIAVHGFGRHVDSTENGPYYPLESAYQRTKFAAENLVRSDGRGRIETVVVRPGLVYGPGDTTTLTPLFDLLVAGRLPRLEGFANLNCPIYIDDLARGIVLALEHPAATGATLDVVSGEKVALGEAIDFAARELRVPSPSRRLGNRAARLIATVGEWASAATGYGFRPPLTRYLVSQLSNDFHFAPQTIEELLGFRAEIEWREGIRRAVADYLGRHPIAAEVGGGDP
jgi:2-alkyl-3-oxoalkanoate reductase